MSLSIEIEPHSGVPVYKQMIAAIIAAIDSGDIEEGERLPSIRKLSAELDVNPNTTAKVYRELELRGYIESRAGSGSFALPQDRDTAAAQKTARMQALIETMLQEARALRIDEQDLVEYLKLRTN